MAISREDAIKQIGEWYGGFSDKPSEDAIHQAISDMDKLQKIEKVLKGWNSDNPRDVIHWEKMRMIEQIVKEVDA